MCSLYIYIYIHTIYAFVLMYIQESYAHRLYCPDIFSILCSATEVKCLLFRRLV